MWTYDSIKDLVEDQVGWVVEAESDCLSISNDEGIDAFLYSGDTQIVVEAPLFSLSSVSNISALNELVLRTHQLLPLTTIGIKTIAGQDYYVAFGALSADSKDSVVLEEIRTLFANVDEFLELYSKYLSVEEAL